MAPKVVVVVVDLGSNRFCEVVIRLVGQLDSYMFLIFFFFSSQVFQGMPFLPSPVIQAYPEVHNVLYR